MSVTRLPNRDQLVLECFRLYLVVDLKIQKRPCTHKGRGRQTVRSAVRPLTFNDKPQPCSFPHSHPHPHPRPCPCIQLPCFPIFSTVHSHTHSHSHSRRIRPRATTKKNTRTAFSKFSHCTRNLLINVSRSPNRTQSAMNGHVGASRTTYGPPAHPPFGFGG